MKNQQDKMFGSADNLTFNSLNVKTNENSLNTTNSNAQSSNIIDNSTNNDYDHSDNGTSSSKKSHDFSPPMTRKRGKLIIS